ncbi:uncharacterized protein LOC112027226 [Quercus suber]|uniref:uncharacterized protein LOC112027226 n=1 Tax=Quercus suber TaxID=58331 RepID=UPI000CE2261D|nr:uncharacterized protein LOC112027226 [Quercus suber]
MEEGPEPPNCMMAQEEILENLVKKAQIQPEEELREINLGVKLASQKPIFIISQLTAQEKELLVALLKSGYNQIRMAAKDVEKIAFRTPIGNFYYAVMPFGLKNVRATYQQTMTAIFHDLMHKEMEDYVDDIVRHKCGSSKSHSHRNNEKAYNNKGAQKFPKEGLLYQEVCARIGFSHKQFIQTIEKGGLSSLGKLSSRKPLEGPADHESSSHPTSTSMWATPVTIFSIKLPNYRSPASIGGR